MNRRCATIVATVAVLAILADSTPVEAGCGVPEPALWSPAREGKAPLDARVVVSLGGFGGQLREVELRPIGGAPVSVQRRELPGPIGHALLELTPEVPLAANTTYELVARRPASWHPNQWVFGAFSTGSAPDAVAPALRVLAARYLEQVAPPSPPLRWLELDVATGPSPATSPSTTAPVGAARAALFAVWLPNARGQLSTHTAPSVYLPREGDTLRISSSELCGGRHVPLPAALGSAPIAVALIDAAGHRSRIERVAVDFAHPTRRSSE